MRFLTLIACASLTFCGQNFSTSPSSGQPVESQLKESSGKREKAERRSEDMKERLKELLKRLDVESLDSEFEKFESMRARILQREIESYNLKPTLRSEPQLENLVINARVENVYAQLQRWVSRKGSKPKAVVFDLDDTLFVSQNRTLKILKSLTPPEGTEFPEVWDHVMSLFKKLKPEQIDYKIEDVLRALGIEAAMAHENFEGQRAHQEVVDHVTKAWFKEFFSIYQFDSIRPGAAGLIKWCESQGIAVFYISARLESKRQATVQQLRNHFLPHAKSRVILRDPAHKEKIGIFKARAVKQVSNQYEVVGVFEDNYENLSTMSQLLKEVQGSAPISVMVGDYHGEKMTSAFGKKIPVLYVPTFEKVETSK